MSETCDYKKCKEKGSNHLNYCDEHWSLVRGYYKGVENDKIPNISLQKV